MFLILAAFIIALEGSDPAQDVSKYQPGDKLEASPVCSANYYPVTLVSITPTPDGTRYTFEYANGHQFYIIAEKRLPGRFATCFRPAPGARAGAGTRPVNAVPAIGARPDRDWLQFRAGSHVEVSPACSAYSYKPATVVAVGPSDFGPKSRHYTVRYDDSNQEFTVDPPGYYVPCVRAAGGIARERAALPLPTLGTYNCNYRGTVAVAFDFALIDASRYRDYDGNTGTYRWDFASRRVLFLSGPKQGFSAQQVSPKTFQILDRDGSTTGNYCPFSRYDTSGKHL